MNEIILTQSNRKGKKWVAIFPSNKTVHFGADGYSDYTKHKDKERKKRYIARHKKREKWGIDGIQTAGFWSRWILWNMPTIRGSVNNLNKNLKQYGYKVILT